MPGHACTRPGVGGSGFAVQGSGYTMHQHQAAPVHGACALIVKQCRQQSWGTGAWLARRWSRACCAAPRTPLSR